MKYWQDYMSVEPTSARCLPVEPSSKPGYVKHVICEGSREHVLSYSGYTNIPGFVQSCNVPNCIVNLERAEILEAHGIES